jgi:hypothetical protein
MLASKGFSFVFCLSAVLLQITGADKSIDAEDATLPAVNFKFEFPMRDLEAGGQKAKSIEEAAMLHQSSQHLLDLIEMDSEVSASFVATANNELDRLADIFGQIRKLKSAAGAM